MGQLANNKGSAVAPPAPKPKFQTSLEANSVACISMEAEVDARADIMWTLLADPDKHPGIFDAIEGASCRLIEEAGPKKRYELDYQARWKFWRVSGVCENRLYMETDADQGTVSFKLREPGFLKVYEGTWRITPVNSPLLNLHSLSRPSHNTSHKAPAPSPGMAKHRQPQSMMHTGSSKGFGGLLDYALSYFSVWQSKTPSSAHTSALAGLLASINNPIPTRGHDALHLPRTLSSTSSNDQEHGDDASSVLQDSSSSSSASTARYPDKSIVRVESMRMSPKMAPPYPLGGLLKNNVVSQVEDMLKGLFAAARQVQDDRDSDSSVMSLSPSTSPSRSLSPSSSTSPSRSLTPSSSYGNLDTSALEVSPKAAFKHAAPAHVASHRISLSVEDDE